MFYNVNQIIHQNSRFSWVLIKYTYRTTKLVYGEGITFQLKFLFLYEAMVHQRNRNVSMVFFSFYP